MAVKNPLVKCSHCEHDYSPNQLKESKLHGGPVCPYCQADQSPPEGGIEAQTGTAKKAWMTNGRGWCV